MSTGQQPTYGPWLRAKDGDGPDRDPSLLHDLPCYRLLDRLALAMPAILTKRSHLTGHPPGNVPALQRDKCGPEAMRIAKRCKL